MKESLSYEVQRSVSNRIDAVQSASELSPDLILMDIMLEDDFSGIDATLKIHS